MPNRISGLWAQVRYPLGFGRQAWKQDDMTVQVFGAGTPANPEVSTIDGARFIDLNFSSTTTGSTAVKGLRIAMTKAGSAACVALSLVASGGATALEMTGGISYSAPTAFTSQESHLLSMGTYTSALVIADTGTTFVAQSINLSSTGNVATPGNQVAAMRLRVDVDTANQANTAISCLQIRSDLAYNCYAATGISGSTNISGNIAIPTASLQGIYYQVTGAGAVTCPNEPNVMEIGYHQSSGGGGFNAVARFDVNATGCSITHILRLKNYAGTVTNALSIEGTVSVGVLFGAIAAVGISMPVGTVSQAILIGTTGAPVAYASTGTLNMVEVNAIHSGASGIVRGVLALLDYSGTNAGTSTNTYAVRGYAKVSGTYGGAAAVAVGIQGKVELSGTITDGRLCPVLAQINSSSGTFTAGELYGLWVSSQLSTGQCTGMTAAFRQNYNMIKVENIGGAGTCNAMISFTGGADVLFQLSDTAGAAWFDATANATTASGKIKLLVGGNYKYIQLYNS